MDHCNQARAKNRHTWLSNTLSMPAAKKAWINSRGRSLRTGASQGRLPLPEQGDATALLVSLVRNHTHRCKEMPSRFPVKKAPSCPHRGKGCLLQSMHELSLCCSATRPSPSPHVVSGLLTLFSKFFATFACATCLLSVCGQYLALAGIHLPSLHCTLKQYDSA